MKIRKSNIISFILGALIFTGISVYAVNQIAANSISYKNGTVEDALNDIYSKPSIKQFCELKTGTANTVGSMYECDPGDGVKRNFYLLALDNDRVDLIMDKNITQGSSATTMTWNNAMKYIGNNNLKTTWSNVLDVDLPKAQAIANAVGYSSWKAVDSGSTWWCFASHKQDSQSAPNCNTSQAQAYNWLYDYTRACNGCSHSLSDTDGQPYGYWTRDAVNETSTARAWYVNRDGRLGYSDTSNATSNGVRPVITVLKSNLY